MSLAQKTALVTGGSRGIGRAICIKLASQGANVVTCYAKSSTAAEETLELCKAAAKENGFEIETKAIQADVSDSENATMLVDEAVKVSGAIDILVNNAGVTRDNLMLRMTEDDFNAVIDTNLRGAFYMMKAVTKPMMKKRAGRIINITSVVGIYGNAGQVNYAASKAGIIGMTKSVAKELGSRGITCNAVAPGFIATDMTAVLSDDVKEKLTKSIALGRLGQPEDIANAVAFFAADEASYVTGQVLEVSGGMF